MRTKLAAAAVVVAGVALVLASGPALAHHAFSAEFDARKPIRFEATIVKVEWINPHVWIHVDAKGPGGKVERWMIEAGNPHNLFRRGFTKDILPVGREIVVDGYQSIDGSRRANGRDLTLPNGRTLFLGSSGTGAPRDGRDPAER